MAESRTLLSQEEIDALVSFLKDNREVSMGSVLDQSSIDKIIDIIRFNNRHGVYFGAETPDLSRLREAEINDPETGKRVSKADCAIECEIGDDDFIRLYCVDSKSSRRYELTPECLEQRSFVTGGTETWGRAIAPRLFNKVANLFRVEFTKETYKFVCDRYAEIIYGRADADMAAVYFPPED